MSRVNREMEVDRGRLIWELLARPCMEYLSEVWWTGGKTVCKNLGKNQENIGRKLVGGNNTVAGVEVREDPKSLWFAKTRSCDLLIHVVVISWFNFFYVKHS